jgi:hypothetical protein
MGNLESFHSDEAPKQTRTKKEILQESSRQLKEIREKTPTYPPFEEIEKDLDPNLSSKIAWDVEGSLTESPDPEKMVLSFDICYPYTRNATYKRLGKRALQSLEFIKTKPEHPVIIFVTGDALKNEAIRKALEELNKYPHVSIQSHGMKHLPVTSKHSKKIFGKPPTASLEKAYEEIVEGAKAIQELTGKKPKYFRAPTLYTDPKVVELVNKLGMEMVSAKTGDIPTKPEREGVAKKGEIYLGHAIYPKAVKAIYKKLDKKKIETTHLPWTTPR